MANTSQGLRFAGNAKSETSQSIGKLKCFATVTETATKAHYLDTETIAVININMSLIYPICL